MSHGKNIHLDCLNKLKEKVVVHGLIYSGTIIDLFDIYPNAMIIYAVTNTTYSPADKPINNMHSGIILYSFTNGRKMIEYYAETKIFHRIYYGNSWSSWY